MNKVANLIKSKANNNFRFIPDQNFYSSIKIGRKRWAQIFRDEKSPTIDELQSIATFFSVDLKELI